MKYVPIIPVSGTDNVESPHYATITPVSGSGFSPIPSVEGKGFEPIIAHDPVGEPYGVLVLENGPTRIVFSSKTGGILSIENIDSGFVHQRFDPGSWKSKEKAAWPPKLANGDPSPFGLYLLYRHYGFDHFGSVLYPEIIDAELTNTQQSGDTVSFTWDIKRLDHVNWTYLTNELLVEPKSGGVYYEGAKFRVGGDIPTSFAYEGRAFLRVSTSVTVDSSGETHYHSFSVHGLIQGITSLAFALHAFEYPILLGVGESIAADGEKSYLAWPDLDGKVLTNPLEVLNPGSTERGIGNPFFMTYPSTYDLTMQFFSLYGTNTNLGLYFATHDNSMLSKTYRLQAADAAFYFSAIHWSDDVCQSYDVLNVISSGVDPTVDPIFYSEYRPVWKDYEQNHYRFIFAQITPRRDEISWYDAAEKYREWARSWSGPIWAQTPRSQRDDFGFYGLTGFGVWCLGSEFGVADAFGDGRQGGNFIKAFHELMIPPTKVLFVMGWDWHYPFGYRALATYQRALDTDRAWWEGRFGPVNLSGDRRFINYDAIVSQGDFIIPYFLGLQMFWLDEKPEPMQWDNQVLTWDGWHEENSGIVAGSPWHDKKLVPNQLTIGKGPNTICPATPEYKQFFLSRNEWIRQGPFSTGTAPGERPLSGVFHDVGFNLVGSRCFFCDDRHSHRLPNGAYGFRVGTGGFINRAKRDILASDMYGEGRARKGIFGTEGVTECFIDLMDTYGFVFNWGPFKTKPPKGFSYFDGLIFDGKIEEIPLIQFVYNRVMPVQFNICNLSGGGRRNTAQHRELFFLACGEGLLERYGRFFRLRHGACGCAFIYGSGHADLYAGLGP